MRIDNMAKQATRLQYITAWIADLEEAIPTLKGPREFIVRERMERQLELLKGVQRELENPHCYTCGGRHPHGYCSIANNDEDYG